MVDNDIFPVLLIVIAAIVCILLLWCAKSKNKKSQGKNGAGDDYEDLIKPDRKGSLLMQYNAKSVTELEEKFDSLGQIGLALKNAGLKSCNLIFGVDFTKSNTWQGQRTFGSRSLHHIEPNKFNPYQQVIRTLGATLESFDEDGLIPAFGFGDKTSRDESAFALCSGGVCSGGFKGVLTAYNSIVDTVQLSGPTNFAPVIQRAVQIVRTTHLYHILIIVADGIVTSERATREAIVEASNWPLSIIVVGVGDGPWETMKEYDDSLPQRRFDNFNFVDYHEVTSTAKNPDNAFALHALMEIPAQYLAIRQLDLLNFD